MDAITMNFTPPKDAEDARNIPFMVHYCVQNIHHTKTVGLIYVGHYEMFINAKAFGFGAVRLNPATGQLEEGINNADILNGVYFSIRDHQLVVQKLCESPCDFILEIDFGNDLIICVRKVLNTFKGVQATFTEEELKLDPIFLQVYVKGDDHVLEDDYWT